MKNVNLYGCTTAEKLIALERGVNVAFEEISKLGLLTTTEQYLNSETLYQIQFIGQPEEYIENGRPIYFINGWVSILRNVDKKSGTFYVDMAIYIRGEDGKDGVDGEKGEKGERGFTGNGITSTRSLTPYISGNDTITPVEITYSDGTTQNITVKAQNGDSSVYVEINPPSGSMSGILTDEQYQTLYENRDARVIINNEIFISADRDFTQGYFTYTHNGIANASGTNFVEKGFTVNVNNKSWLITVAKSATPTKIFSHVLNCSADMAGYVFNVYITNTRKDPYHSLSELHTGDYCALGSYVPDPLNPAFVQGLYKDGDGNIKISCIKPINAGVSVKFEMTMQTPDINIFRVSDDVYEE